MAIYIGNKWLYIGIYSTYCDACVCKVCLMLHNGRRVTPRFNHLGVATRPPNYYSLLWQTRHKRDFSFFLFLFPLWYFRFLFEYRCLRRPMTGWVVPSCTRCMSAADYVAQPAGCHFFLCIDAYKRERRTNQHHQFATSEILQRDRTEKAKISNIIYVPILALHVY